MSSADGAQVLAASTAVCADGHLVSRILGFLVAKVAKRTKKRTILFEQPSTINIDGLDTFMTVDDFVVMFLPCRIASHRWDRMDVSHEYGRKLRRGTLGNVRGDCQSLSSHCINVLDCFLTVGFYDYVDWKYET